MRQHHGPRRVGQELAAQEESGQWLLGKAMEAFAHIGPPVVTTEEIANPGLVCFMLCLKHNKQTDYRSLPGGFQFEAAYEVSVCLVSWTLSLAPITYLDRITKTYEDLK